LSDNDGDGSVFKIGAQNDNGTFAFEVELPWDDVSGELN
jgi:hypothetical protein